MNRIILTLVLCSAAHSIVIIPPGVDEIVIPPEFSTTCAHNEYTGYPVIAWPGDSCAAVTKTPSPSLSTNTAHPLSCPPTTTNTKCFPIAEDLTASELFDFENDQQIQLELRRKRRNTLPDSTPSAHIARSVSLKWPDPMTHVLFFVDESCQYLDAAGHAWHVERKGLAVEQCVDLSSLEGQFGSVEFMRQEEWETWDARRRGVDRGDRSAGWGGVGGVCFDEGFNPGD